VDGTAANSSELGGQPASAYLGVDGTAANSSELGGQPASAYLGVDGTAANSSELGGQPASAYMTGEGQVSRATGIVDLDNTYTVPLTVADNAFELQFTCASASAGYFTFTPDTYGEAWDLASDGQTFTNFSGNAFEFGPTTLPATSAMQLAFGSDSDMVTLWLSDAEVISNTGCLFAVQAISSG
jgi:hypothetical protein